MPAVSYINERMITNMLGAIYYSREDLIGIHVITDSGKVYNYGNHMNVIDYLLHTRNGIRRFESQWAKSHGWV
nr:hypothetical protein [Paenibacillus kribbensis]